MQKLIILFFLSAFLGLGSQSHKANRIKPDQPDTMFTGAFVDDYGIRYQISDTLWLQKPNARYHIIKWNTKEQYLIARNDKHNPGDGGLYTRIDFMQFSKMEPWLWGYCLSVYNAQNDSIAEVTAHADRQNPKKGCNGYPFSRMKRVE